MRAKLIITMALTVMAPALAVGHGPPTPYVFSVHDLDRDGYLSRAEYAALRAHCAERRGTRCAALLDFDTLDGNRDGRIDEDELLQIIGRRHRGGRADADAPGSGLPGRHAID